MNSGLRLLEKCYKPTIIRRLNPLDNTAINSILYILLFSTKLFVYYNKTLKVKHIFRKTYAEKVVHNCKFKLKA